MRGLRKGGVPVRRTRSATPSSAATKKLVTEKTGKPYRRVGVRLDGNGHKPAVRPCDRFDVAHLRHLRDVGAVNQAVGFDVRYLLPPGRCPAERGMQQCFLDAGHAGPHVGVMTKWTDRKPAWWGVRSDLYVTCVANDHYNRMTQSQCQAWLASILPPHSIRRPFGSPRCGVRPKPRHGVGRFKPHCKGVPRYRPAKPLPSGPRSEPLPPTPPWWAWARDAATGLPIPPARLRLVPRPEPEPPDTEPIAVGQTA